MPEPLRFTILHRSASTHARLGRVETPHGAFDTPAFMPVGTRGTIKGLLPRDVAATGAQIVLGNTYHLMLRPGSELVAKLGGLHGFMRWQGPILTDSGGYQAFSLSDTTRLDDEGVTFKSIMDGSMVRLTPRRAMEVQNELGADIIMAFDDCPPGNAEPGRVLEANERTLRWLEECSKAHARRDEQALFGIVQGGTDFAKRTWCAQRVAQIDLPGYAIGGVAVGEAPEAIFAVVGHTAPLLPADKPRYLMGVGYERDLVMAVRAGVDMFDCVLPTRNGRNAGAFTARGPIRLRNQKHALEDAPIEEGCDCAACAAGFSRAYLRHLFLVGEMLGPILVSLHNLRHFQRLMADLRRTIAGDDWEGFAGRWPVLADQKSEK